MFRMLPLCLTPIALNKLNLDVEFSLPDKKIMYHFKVKAFVLFEK